MEEFKDEQSQELHFHYNREERLKRAPQIVKDFHNGTNQVPPKGIFRRLVYTKSSRLMLITIVILCAGSYLINFLSSRDNRDTLLKVPMTLSAFSFEDSIYVSVKAAEVSDSAYSFDVEITTLTTGNTPVHSFSEHKLYDGKELVLTTTFPDYDILRVNADITAESGETIHLSTDVTQ